LSTDIPSTAAQGRAGCVVPALVVLVAVGVLAVAFLGSTCVRGGSDTSFSAPVERFRVDDPVYISSKGFYLVRLASGEMVALSDQEARREDRLNGCLIRYRETAQAGGRTGLFRADCSGTLFDHAGKPVEGSAPPMKRLPLTISGGKLKVDLTTCIDGASGQRVSCKA
jgi:hypothetical protein